MSDASQYADRAGRYRLDGMIATGGMGMVWRATDTRLRRQVAVKVLKPEYAHDLTFRTRFESEARSAAALHHPGIAGVFDYGTDDGGQLPPYLVMELVDGEPLSALLATARNDGRTFDLAVVQDLIAQAGDALGAAHDAGIVHRDVKPANLLVTPEGTVKITDFGIARAAESAALTLTGSVIGTPQYLSPEQALGNPTTPASDVYSLGVVAFECLAGRRPFQADTHVAMALAHVQQPLPQLPASVPAPIAAVVTRALAKDPAARFPDGSAFASAIRSAAPAATASAGDLGHATAILPTVHEGRPEAGWSASVDHAHPTPRRAIVVTVVLLAALLGALVYLKEGGNTDRADRDPGTTSGATPSDAASQGATVALDAKDYVCLANVSYHRAASELRSRGLKVSVEQSPDANESGCPAHSVASISPTGSLHRGDRVTIQFWGPAATGAPKTSSASSSPEGSASPSSGSSARGTASSANSSPSASPSSERSTSPVPVPPPLPPPLGGAPRPPG